MPIKLTDLKRDRRTLTIPIVVGQDELTNDVTEDLVLTYQPSKNTPRSEQAFNEALKDEWKSKAAIGFLTNMVVDWDLQDDGGDPYPITEDAMAELPQAFLTAIIKAIGDDMGKGQAPSSDS